MKLIYGKLMLFQNDHTNSLLVATLSLWLGDSRMLACSRLLFGVTLQASLGVGVRVRYIGFVKPY